jgi:phosphinothricin acetyltransferase
MQSTPGKSVVIRPAAAGDGAPMVALLERIAGERRWTAITEPWSAGEQESYLARRSHREAVHVACGERGTLIGYQVLELWAPTLGSMAHAGQIGTFLASEWRGQGVGRELFLHTRRFAAANGYAKFIAQIRAGNESALRFYRGLGFEPCGRFARQVRIDGVEEDEILMEYFL